MPLNLWASLIVLPVVGLLYLMLIAAISGGLFTPRSRFGDGPPS
jgi:hypothetical protein